MSTT
jgi:lipoate-protein ligase A